MRLLIKQSTRLLVILAVVLSGCKKDFFDAEPDNQISVEKIFQNKLQAEGWRGGMFKNIPDVWNQPYAFFWSVVTDEMDCSNWTNEARSFHIRDLNSGAYSASVTYTEANANPLRFYENIRMINIFLANIDKTPDITADNLKLYKAEAHFLRGYYIWNMMKQLGPIVLPATTASDVHDNFQKPRSTWNECIKTVLADLDLAIPDLPADFYNNDGKIEESQLGHINKMVVQAIKSEVLLYDASPLYNGNSEFSDFKNLDGTVLLNQQYDANKWKLAANATKEAIRLAEANGKKLYKVSDPDPFRQAFLSVRNLYWEGWKEEGIFMRPSTNTFAQWERHAAPRSTGNTGGYNGLAVIQEIVDEFEMKDGKKITQSSTYSENKYATADDVYYVTGTNSMYWNREPRFYAFVSFNGSKNPAKSKQGVNNSRVEFFNTGTSGKAGAPRDFPNTGYTARKNIHPSMAVDPNTNIARPAMLIRLAELYLNHAEALNESSPGDANILFYLNLVRTRAGLPAATGGSQSEVREKIRHERRIELAFEGQRYFDVRRWKVADKPGYYQGGSYYGMNMNGGTFLADPTFHVRTKALKRGGWNRRNYFLPYNQIETDRNKLLVQIPGY